MSYLLLYPWRPKLCWEMLEINLFGWIHEGNYGWKKLLWSSGSWGTTALKYKKVVRRPASSSQRPAASFQPMTTVGAFFPVVVIVIVVVTDTLIVFFHGSSASGPQEQFTWSTQFNGRLANTCLCQEFLDSSPGVSWCIFSGMPKYSDDSWPIEGTATGKWGWLLSPECANYIDIASTLPEGHFIHTEHCFQILSCWLV